MSRSDTAGTIARREPGRGSHTRGEDLQLPPTETLRFTPGYGFSKWRSTGISGAHEEENEGIGPISTLLPRRL
jgi:hypothetical protein